jgi:hypothetical protein
MESAPMQYGGNIVVGRGGVNSVYAELAEGTHSELVGGKTPILKIRRNLERGRFEFTPFSPNNVPGTEDYISYATETNSEEDIRRALFGAVLAIPREEHEDNGPGFELRGAHFTPGYYEFALIEKQPNAPLSPVFIDYSDEKPFVFND